MRCRRKTHPPLRIVLSSVRLILYRLDFVPFGADDVIYHLSSVQMAPSARKAVTGDGICIGLTYKGSPFIHPETTRNRGLVEAIVAGVRSHPELRNIAFTSIQINRNTISAPHVDNNLAGTPSIAIGLGKYDGGRLRVDGAKQPLHIRDHAVVFDGAKLHSSGLLNGDRWSLVLLIHSSWEYTTNAMRQQLTGLGLPCPPSGPTTAAVPAVEGASSTQAGFPSDAAAAGSDLQN